MCGNPWESCVSAVALHLHRSAKAAQGLQRIAALLAPAGTIKAKLRAAHQRTGLPFNRTRDLWYGRARRIDDAELHRIEAALPPDNPELPLAHLRSVESRVASALAELRSLVAQLESESGHGPVGRAIAAPEPRGARSRGAPSDGA